MRHFIFIWRWHFIEKLTDEANPSWVTHVGLYMVDVSYMQARRLIPLHRPTCM